MAQEVFERYEKKYLINTTQYRALLSGMQSRIKRDLYGKYTICNIYYDTPDYQLIRTSLEKPFYKEKLRLRSYGVAEPQSPVFLEIKKKCDGIVYKRRTQFTHTEAMNYLQKGIQPQKDSQIQHELDWFIRRYGVEPKVFLAYDREAYTGIEDPELRITFDTAIRCRETSLSLSAGSDGTFLLPQNSVLMEVKISAAMPYWMAELFAELKIYPVSFSKYGTYYQQKIANEQKGIQKYA